MTPTTHHPDHRVASRIAVCVALVGLCATAYSGVVNLPFLQWDDQVYVTENGQVKQGLTWEGLSWAWTTQQAHNRHPITWLSHMLDCQIFGSESATGHHLMNLVFHMANTALLLFVWNRTTRQFWPAVLLAALFAVHPLNVESVAWVAERKNVLSTFFWLLTMLAYCVYTERPSWTRYVAILCIFALGLMSKQMLVTLPCVLLLLDVWPLNRMSGFSALGGIPRPNWVVRVVEKLPLAVLSLVASLAVLNVQEAAKATWTDLPLSQRLANAVVSYTGYLQHAIWPSDLSVLYMHPRNSLAPAAVFTSLLVLLSISWISLYSLRQHKYFAVGWLWYLGTLVPVIGLVQVGEQAMADRYTYVPLIGIWLIVAYGSAELVRWRPALQGWVAAAAVVTLLALTAATRQQVKLWEGMLPLWNHALLVDENNYQAHLQVAMALRREDRFEEAIPHYEMAAQLESQRVELHTELAELQVLLGNTKAAEESLEQAISIDPHNAAAHYWLGVLLVESGELERGVVQLRTALGYLHDEVLRDQSSSVSEIDILYNLAVAEIQQEHFVAAIDWLTKATRIGPGDAEASSALALAHYRLAMKQLGEDPFSAADHLRAALIARPDWIEAGAALAQLLATHPNEQVHNGEESLRLATQVCQATNYKDLAALELLANAHVELGDFDSALRVARQALDLARNQDNVDVLARVEQAIQHYLRKEPFRMRWTS